MRIVSVDALSASACASGETRVLSFLPMAFADAAAFTA
ncbi:hypothetical protein C7S17_6827 [Burkholderia thailandensis]|nr:hypothetical protein [Burkholderia thailandensis]